jgi:hypothetical protein
MISLVRAKLLVMPEKSHSKFFDINIRQLIIASVYTLSTSTAEIATMNWRVLSAWIDKCRREADELSLLRTENEKGKRFSAGGDHLEKRVCLGCCFKCW